MIDINDGVGLRPLLEASFFGVRECGRFWLRWRLARSGEWRWRRPDEPEILLAAGVDDMGAEFRPDLENGVRQAVVVRLGCQAGIQLAHDAREVFGGGEAGRQCVRRTGLLGWHQSNSSLRTPRTCATGNGATETESCWFPPRISTWSVPDIPA